MTNISPARLQYRERVRQYLGVFQAATGLSTRRLAVIIGTERTNLYNIKKGLRPMTGYQLARLLDAARRYGLLEAALEAIVCGDEPSAESEQSSRLRLRSSILARRKRTTDLTR